MSYIDDGRDYGYNGDAYAITSTSVHLHPKASKRPREAVLRWSTWSGIGGRGGRCRGCGIGAVQGIKHNNFGALFIRTGEMAFDDIQRRNADRLTVAYGRLPINLRHDREVDVELRRENRAVHLDIAGDCFCVGVNGY
jgi:hypothetical protein